MDARSSSLLLPRVLALALFVVLATGAIVSLLVIWVATDDWSRLLRVAACLPSASLLLVAARIGGDATRFNTDWRMFRPRRMGGRAVVVSGGRVIDPKNLGARVGLGVPEGFVDESEARFGVKRGASQVAAAVGVAGVVVAGWVALGASERGDMPSGPIIVGVVGLAYSLWLLIRSMVRVIRSGGAIVIDGRSLRLGVALGYFPPLRIERGRVGAISISGRYDTVVFIIDRARTHSVQRSHLEDPDAFHSWLKTHWSDVPVKLDD